MGRGPRHVPLPSSLVSKFRVLPVGLDWLGSTDSCHRAATGSCSSLHPRLGSGIYVLLRLLLLADLLHDSLWRPSIRCSVSAAYSDYACRRSFPGTLRDDVGPDNQKVRDLRGTPRSIFLDLARMGSTRRHRTALECYRLFSGPDDPRIADSTSPLGRSIRGQLPNRHS